MVQKEYDISLAVQAVRALFAEAHTCDECNELVWKPTKFWLKQLTNKKHQEISCLYEIPIPDNNSTGYSSNAYIVVPQKRIIYLGTILSKKEAESKFAWFKEFFPERAKELKKRGPMAIIRWWNMCCVPVNAITLTREAIQKGVQKYLREFAPTLADLPISWMAQDRQNEICLEILGKAFSTASRQTREERLKIYRDNF